MKRSSLAVVLAVSTLTAACGRLGLSDQAPEPSYYEPLPAPAPAPATVQSQSLAPLPPQGGAMQPGAMPPAPGVPGQQAALAPGQIAPAAPPAMAPAPVSADRARALTMSDLAGDWALVSGADNCRVTMSLTSWAGGRRAMSRGCLAPELQLISAWVLDGKQVVLKGSDGAMVATLYSAVPEQFAGTTVSRQPISLSR
jgi:hypothetical protein